MTKLFEKFRLNFSKQSSSTKFNLKPYNPFLLFRPSITSKITAAQVFCSKVSNFGALCVNEQKKERQYFS